MPDVVEVPVTDEVTFTWSRRRVVLAQLAIGVIVAMIGAGPSLLYGMGTVGPWFAAACLATVWIFSSLTMIAAVLAVTAACPPWLRLSQAGIELAGSRTDPVFIAWPAVASVRFRWRGPLTYLEVAPSDPAAVGWGRRGGRRPGRRRSGRLTFVVDVGILSAGPAAVRAALAHHGWPSPTAVKIGQREL